MGGATMTILLAFLAIGTVSSRTLDNWNIETSCPLTARPTYQPHPLNCNFYLFCTGNSLTPFLQRCPNGQVFDRNLGYCSESSKAKCLKHPNSIRAHPIQIMDVKPNDLPCAQSDYIRYVPHPSNCSRFFECSMAQVVEMECPPGLYFLPHLELCGRSPLTCGVSLNSHNNRIKRECPKIATPKCPTINVGYDIRLPHQNCDSFYQCINGAPVRMQCPPGLHFDSLRQECDFPGRLECNKCSSINGVGKAESEEEHNLCPKYYQGNVRHPKHCDRFYSCASGHPMLRQCPIWLLFNPVTQKCDWPTSVECLNDYLDMVPEPGDIDDGMDTCETYENCKHGSLLPDTSDCSSFYQCVWGQPVHMKCPDDLYFNPKLQVCDWPLNVECEDDSSSSSSDGSSSSSSEGDDSDENESDIEDSDPDYSLEELSSETDEEDQEEDLPAEVTASLKKITKQNKCLPVSFPVSHECEMPKCPPYNYGFVVQFYNPFNCSEFFKCNWGEPIKFSCSSGLHYNRRLQVCDYPERADCALCDDEESASSENILVKAFRKELSRKPRTACKSELTSLPDPDECRSYYKCQDGELRKKSCPKGLRYNPVQKVCDFPSNTFCGAYRETPNSSCPEIDSNVCSLGRKDIFVNPTDCSSYYQCEKGKLSLKKCPQGLEFNAVMKTCDRPQNAKCKQCEEGREKRAECSGSLYGQSAVLPDPNNCNAYYRCEWGSMVLYKCPDGLHFNSVLEVCDLPERSRCKK